MQAANVRERRGGEGCGRVGAARSPCPRLLGTQGRRAALPLALGMHKQGWHSCSGRPVSLQLGDTQDVGRDSSGSRCSGFLALGAPVSAAPSACTALSPAFLTWHSF